MFWKLTPRMALILVHDLLAAVAAVLAAFYIRFEAKGLAERWDLAESSDLFFMPLPAFVLYALMDAVVDHSREDTLRWVLVELGLVALQAAVQRALGLVRSLLGARLSFAGRMRPK